MKTIKTPIIWGPAFGLGGSKLHQLELFHLDLGGVLLEEGCAMGFVVGNINSSEKYGIDIDTLLIEQAKNYYPDVKFSLQPAGATQFSDCFFDSVLCLDVIEHAAGDIRLVREANRMLKPGGLLVISTPIKGTSLLPFSGGLTDRLHKAWGHVRVYRMDELKGILESNGFKVTQTRVHFRLLSRLIFYCYLRLSEYLVRKNLPWAGNTYLGLLERMILVSDKIESFLGIGKPFQMFVVAIKV